MNDDWIELERSENGDRFEYRESRRPLSLLITKLIFWSTVAGGIAVGTILFLFFLTLFIYFFIPILIVTSIWALIHRLRPR